MDMIAGRRMLASAAEFHAVELGEGPPLLFLHGVTANACTWLPVMELLRDSFRTVAIDQRGHGRTGLPRDRRFNAAAYARDTADLAAFIGWGPVVLVDRVRPVHRGGRLRRPRLPRGHGPPELRRPR